MRNPLRTKNTSTPRNPPVAKLPCTDGHRNAAEWWSITKTTATARRPSRAGRYPRWNWVVEAEASAGRFYRSEVTDLKQTFDLIADELRHQYRLGFYANSQQADGTIHHLSVQVARPDAVVRARRTYRAGQGQ